jgi:hypothetical protein
VVAIDWQLISDRSDGLRPTLKVVLPVDSEPLRNIVAASKIWNRNLIGDMPAVARLERLQRSSAQHVAVVIKDDARCLRHSNPCSRVFVKIPRAKVFAVDGMP